MVNLIITHIHSHGPQVVVKDFITKLIDWVTIINGSTLKMSLVMKSLVIDS